ncbi:MAG: GFA family protein [Pseudomonadales bacterium]
MTNHCQCPCGNSRFTFSKAPTRRFLCHCTICQQVYQKPFADVTVMSAARVKVETPDSIEYAKHKDGQALDRGVCKSCRAPVVGFLDGLPMMRLAFFPCINIVDQGLLPSAQMHIFYHERSADVDDALPKIEGDKQSMFRSTGLVLKGFFGI